MNPGRSSSHYVERGAMCRLRCSCSLLELLRGSLLLALQLRPADPSHSNAVRQKAL